MRSVRLALAAGLVLTATALGVVLSRSPLTVAGTNGVPANLAVLSIRGSSYSCQLGGTVPAGTTAVRVSLSANTGPSVSLKVLEGSALVTDGAREAGWGVTETVTVPVRKVSQTVNNARICMRIGAAVEPIQVNGSRAQTTSGQRVVLLRFEYMRPGPRSWLSLASSVAHSFGIAHAPSGAWVAYLVVAVMLALSALASRLILRELR